MKKHHLKKHPLERYMEDSENSQNNVVIKEDSYASHRDWIDELFVFDQGSPKTSKSESSKAKNKTKNRKTLLNWVEESKEEEK